jgi:hypothetical protein
MRKNFRVRRQAAPPEHTVYARRVLDLTYLHSDFNEHRDESCTAPERRQQYSLELLRMANGDWRKRKFVHFCTFNCCRSVEASDFENVGVRVQSIFLYNSRTF